MAPCCNADMLLWARTLVLRTRSDSHGSIDRPGVVLADRHRHPRPREQQCGARQGHPRRGGPARPGRRPARCRVARLCAPRHGTLSKPLGVGRFDRANARSRAGQANARAQHTRGRPLTTARPWRLPPMRWTPLCAHRNVPGRAPSSHLQSATFWTGSTTRSHPTRRPVRAPAPSLARTSGPGPKAHSLIPIL